MSDYYQLESVLLAVQSRHHIFFEDEGTLIVDYVSIVAIAEDMYGLKSLQNLPPEIFDDLNAALGR